MDSKSLTPYQLQQLQGRVGPMRHYLNKLAEHMRAREFPLDDELLVAVDEAHDAVRLLTLLLNAIASRGERRDECDANGIPVKLPSWITARRKKE